MDLEGNVHSGGSRLRTYAVNIADAHPARLPPDIVVAAEGARKAIALAAPQLGVPEHRCFAIPVPAGKEPEGLRSRFRDPSAAAVA